MNQLNHLTICFSRPRRITPAYALAVSLLLSLLLGSQGTVTRRAVFVDGKIDADSFNEQGTFFRLTLPVREA